MQTDMLVFQDINNGFAEVIENGKSIKFVKKTDSLTEEADNFLLALTGLLNEPVVTVPEAEKSLTRPDENIKLLELETPAIDQPEALDFSDNKVDSKSGFIIIQPDIEEEGKVLPETSRQPQTQAEPAIAEKDIAAQNQDIKKIDLNFFQKKEIKTQNGLNSKQSSAASVKNPEILSNPSELLHLKNDAEIDFMKKNLPETSRQPQTQAEPAITEKDIAAQNQDIKKIDLNFFQKKEAFQVDMDKGLGDKSDSREGSNNSKELFSNLELKGQSQNRLNKAQVQIDGSSSLKYTAEVNSDIIESDFRQVRNLLKKDSNISKIQVGAVNNESNFKEVNSKEICHKETGHIFLKNHLPEQVVDVAGTGKGNASVSKPAATEIMSQIVDKAVLTLRKGQNEMRIRLKPESLGRINLKIVTENNQVMVKIMADTAYVKQLIENNIYHLKTDLSSHGLEIDKFDVFVGDDSGRNAGKDGNSELFKMKSGKYTGRDSEKVVDDEPEASVQIIENENEVNLVGVFA